MDGPALAEVDRDEVVLIIQPILHVGFRGEVLAQPILADEPMGEPDGGVGRAERLVDLLFRVTEDDVAETLARDDLKISCVGALGG